MRNIPFGLPPPTDAAEVGREFDVPLLDGAGCGGLTEFADGTCGASSSESLHVRSTCGNENLRFFLLG